MSRPKAHVHKGDGHLTADIKRFERLTREINDFRTLTMGRKILPKMGDIPAPSRLGSLTIQDNPLTNLPNELILTVIANLGIADRTCLALTCKELATLIESAKAAEATKLRSQGRRPPSPTKPQRLALLIRLQRWMPLTLRLCFECLLYRKNRKGSELACSNHWGGDPSMMNKKTLTGKMIVAGPRCPLCVRRGKLECAADKKVLQDFKKNVARLEMKGGRL